jgi:hypothetical protein
MYVVVDVFKNDANDAAEVAMKALKAREKSNLPFEIQEVFVHDIALESDETKVFRVKVVIEEVPEDEKG